MGTENITRERLVVELKQLHQRVSELEAAQAECKQTEQALQESQRLYHLLSENVRDVIWTMDTNLRYTYKHEKDQP
jgi:PAS domain-containing protein